MKNSAINIAPTSTHGHFVKNAKQVINLDNINETFFVEGPSVLETENHTTLQSDDSCLITCQHVLNPFTGYYEKSKD